MSGDAGGMSGDAGGMSGDAGGMSGDAGVSLEVQSAAVIQMAAQYLSTAELPVQAPPAASEAADAANAGSVGWWKSAVMDAVADGNPDEQPHTTAGMNETPQQWPQSVNPSSFVEASAAAASLAGLVNSLPPTWQGLVGSGTGMELLDAVRAVGQSSASDSLSGVYYRCTDRWSVRKQMWESCSCTNNCSVHKQVCVVLFTNRRVFYSQTGVCCLFTNRCVLFYSQTGVCCSICKHMCVLFHLQTYVCSSIHQQLFFSQTGVCCSIHEQGCVVLFTNRCVLFYSPSAVCCSIYSKLRETLVVRCEPHFFSDLPLCHFCVSQCPAPSFRHPVSELMLGAWGLGT
jgi:hypothetical protein